MNLFRCSAMAVFAWMAATSAHVAMAGGSTLGAGLDFSCAVVDEGVQCWGTNEDGALGNPAFGDVSTATDVPLLKPGTHAGVTALTAGDYHVCAIVGGGVMCWGFGYNGQLGNGGTDDSPSPVVVIPAGSGVTAIAAGGYHTCAVVSGGVNCWGYNYYHQLGDGTQEQRSSPVTTIPSGSAVTDVSAGTYHTCAVRNGGAYCWGDNSNGQLGNATYEEVVTPELVIDEGSAVSAVAAGGNFTCVIQGAGQSASAKCWGSNLSGQLGTNTLVDQNNAKLATPVVNAVGKVVAIVAGSTHACVIQNGSAKCWGSNTKGKLGIGTTTNAQVATLIAGLTPVAMAAGSSHTCLREGTATLDVYCWGPFGHGRLGANRDDRFLKPTSTPSGGSPVLALAEGYGHGCMLTVAGAVRCWGSNASGQAGDGSGMPVRYVSSQVAGISINATAVSTGNFHSCAVVSGGVQCWGQNGHGQVGNNSTMSQWTPTPVLGSNKAVSKLAMGGYHTCAIGNDGTYCWGANFHMQLADSSLDDIKAPKRINALIGKNVTDIAAGGAHTCAIVDGGVQCWGSNADRQIGDPMNSGDHDVPYSIIPSNSNVTGIAAGVYHTCAIVDGGIQCWGNNSYGQLGNNTTSSSATPVQPVGFIPMYGVTSIAAGGAHTCAMTHDAMFCWGSNDSGELGTGTFDQWPQRIAPTGLGYTGGVVVTGIATGSNASCAIVSGQANCWGSNREGALGVNILDYRSTPIKVIANDVLFANRFERKP